MIRQTERGIALLSGLALSLGAVTLGAMALLGAADVLSDNLLARPLPAASEAASDYLPAAILLAAGWAQRERADITVDILTSGLSARWRGRLALLALALAIVFLGALAWGAWAQAVRSIGLGEFAVAAVQYPVWPAKVAFACGLSIAALECLRLFLRGLAGTPLPTDPAVSR